MRALRIAAVLVVLAAPGEARGEQLQSCGKPDRVCLRMRDATTVRRDDGYELRLPPGRFVDEATWRELDAEFVRLQDAETRLTTENRSMREATSGWQPGWKTLAAATIAGIALGAYVTAKIY